MRRRTFLGIPLLGLARSALSHESKVAYPPVLPNPHFNFPRDHGAHPDFRIEWWYVTGWLDQIGGFQITFFRARPEEATDNPSQFTPRQILLAHAALSDPKRGRLVHDERAARAGFSLAEAETDRTGVWIDDWHLELAGDRYLSRIAARGFDFDLTFFTRGIVLQGEKGFSRKGHRPHEASYYYSRPQLSVVGTVSGQRINGTAWLDHEWSSTVMAPEASGWDWCGINFYDGSHLMAFQMRAKAGGVYYADPGTSFEVLRTWKSPRTGVAYPVSMLVRKDKREIRLEPLMDDQELDARASSGTIYWEGAVRAYPGRNGKNEIGRGYLELTGYWRPMKL